jgi:CBS domain-containing protein
MSTRVVSLRPDETVAAAVERMKTYGFSALPVTTSTSRLVGMVSLLDVIRYREEHEEQGLEADEEVHVSEIMNPHVVSMAATANVAAVARRLAESGQLRVLPVVNGSKLVGIVTRSDLLRAFHATPERGERPDQAEQTALLALARQRRTGPRPPADTPVREVMTTQIVSVAPSDPIAMAGRSMLRDRHTTLPVVESGGTLVGIISEADILADPYAGRQAHATVSTVMTGRAISIDVAATVGEAHSLVADRGVRLLPVVDGGVLVGVLTRSDLF